MKHFLEIKVLKVEDYKSFVDSNGQTKKTDTIASVYVETFEEKDGIKLPTFLKLNSTTKEIALGMNKVEVKITAYFDKKTQQSKISYKILKVVK